jgi:hypothetical protein
MLLFTVCLFVLGSDCYTSGEFVRVSWLCALSSRRDSLIHSKWMFCEIVRLRARSAPVVRAISCPGSATRVVTPDHLGFCSLRSCALSASIYSDMKPWFGGCAELRCKSRHAASELSSFAGVDRGM